MRKMFLGLGFATALALAGPAFAQGVHHGSNAMRHPINRDVGEVRQVQPAPYLLQADPDAAIDAAPQSAASEFIGSGPYPYDSPDVLNARERN